MFAVLEAARKSMGRHGLSAAAAVALLGLAACEPGPMGGGQATAPGGTVPVALLVPSGSGQAGDERLATNLQNAAKLAVSDLNGAKIDLRVYPTGASAQTAAAAATKAADEGAQVIVGPLYSQASNAAGRAVASRGIDVLSLSNNTAIAGGNVFVLGQTFATTADRLVKYAASQGKKSIFVMHENNAAGQAGFKAISDAINGAGLAMAGQASYPFSQQGIVQAGPGIASQIKSSGADAVFYTSDTAGALPLITQVMSENGVDPAITQYIGLTRWDIPPTTLSLPGVQHGWFAEPDPALSQQFASRYTATYGSAPLPVAGLAYDGIAAIGALIKAGKPINNQTLTQPDGFIGVNGVFRLLPDGTDERGLAVAQILNNQVHVIDPAPRSFGGAGF